MGFGLSPRVYSHPLRGGAKRSGDARCNVVLQIGHKVLHVMAIHYVWSTTHATTQLSWSRSVTDLIDWAWGIAYIHVYLCKGHTLLPPSGLSLLPFIKSNLSKILPPIYVTWLIGRLEVIPTLVDEWWLNSSIAQNHLGVKVAKSIPAINLTSTTVINQCE